jgi:predicted component of type VI protein secretion system
MARPLGSSFAPIAANDEETKRLPPAQQAIQVLSMRIPRVRGARSISPLVGEPGSAARRQIGGFSPESAVLQTLMQTLAPAAAPSAPMGSLPGAASPSLGARNPMSAAMEALGGGLAAPPSFAPPRPFQAQQPGSGSGSSASMPIVPGGPPPAPVVVPGVGVPEPPQIFERPMEQPPQSSGAVAREPRTPVMPSPRIPDQGEGREPREPRDPRTPPVPTLPPPTDDVFAPPSQGRVPQTPRDPNEPIEIRPPAEGVNTPGLGSVSPEPPSFDPRILAAVVDALFRKGGRRF